MSWMKKHATTVRAAAVVALGSLALGACQSLFQPNYSTPLEATRDASEQSKPDCTNADCPLVNIDTVHFAKEPKLDALIEQRLLEMTRTYTREKMAARGTVEVNALAFRHAAFYMDLLGHLGTTPDEIFRNSALLASQLGNVRSALEWSFGPHGDPGLALPLR